MTSAQQEVFAKISELVREHFEGSLIVVMDETEEGKMGNLQYNGGLLQAIGLARVAALKLEEYQMDSIALRQGEEEEEE
jgi:hypothetical protein